MIKNNLKHGFTNLSLDDECVNFFFPVMLITQFLFSLIICPSFKNTNKNFLRWKKEQVREKQHSNQNKRKRKSLWKKKVKSQKETCMKIKTLNYYGVFGWGNLRGWFIYLENLKFFVMKCFVWIEKLKNI